MSRRPPPPPEEAPFYVLLMVNSSIATASVLAALAAFTISYSYEIAFVAFLATLVILTILRRRVMNIFWPTNDGGRPPRRRR